MKKNQGSVGNLMTTGMCMLAMTVLLLVYLENVRLIQQKMDVNQLVRKYILRMETVGCLTTEDRNMLNTELHSMGVTNVEYEGTTEGSVSYGEAICLQIQGKLEGKYDFEEKRVSTAKN